MSTSRMDKKFVDDLRRERETAATAFHYFLLDYSRAPQGVFAFFEGRDDASFYAGFIIRYVAEDRPYHSYNCGGKDAVYQAHAKIHAHGKVTAITLFFVDGDLSRLLDEKYPSSRSVYVTDFYSIENYLVAPAMIRRMFVELVSYPVTVTGCTDGTLILDLAADKVTDSAGNGNGILVPLVAVGCIAVKDIVEVDRNNGFSRGWFSGNSQRG